MNFMMMMDYGTFMKYQIVAMISGGILVGSWWLASKWDRDYKEARDAGVVK